tara:strand:- start:8885 stop:9325 length:441 start_codon:yes stop_codon:yes gene_type:complete
MNIYFAASISGGRENIEIYKQIGAILESKGEVLTKQVFSDTHTQEEPVRDMDGKIATTEDIYTQDKLLMDKADVLVADITTPSTGVGYEIGLAEARNIPILVIFRNDGKRKSAVVLGNTKFVCKEYEKIENLKKIINDFFKDFASH